MFMPITFSMWFPEGQDGPPRYAADWIGRGATYRIIGFGDSLEEALEDLVINVRDGIEQRGPQYHAELDAYRLSARRWSSGAG